MKHPLLTIAVPTYNRAAKVEAQLGHIVSALFVEIVSGEVELICADNASTDETSIRVALIGDKLPSLRVVRNERNLGLIGNYRRCLELARGRYTWVCGDDDLLLPGSPVRVLHHVRQACEFGCLLVIHDFTMRNGLTGKRSALSYYAQLCRRIEPGGGTVPAQELFACGCEGLLWLTGNILRTEEARLIAGEDPMLWDNFALPYYVGARAAISAPIWFSGETLFEMVTHTTSWASRGYCKLISCDFPIVRKLLGKRLGDQDSINIIKEALLRYGVRENVNGIFALKHIYHNQAQAWSDFRVLVAVGAFSWWQLLSGLAGAGFTGFTHFLRWIFRKNRVT